MANFENITLEKEVLRKRLKSLILQKIIKAHRLKDLTHFHVS